MRSRKARVEHLYAIADGEIVAEPGEPEVIFRMDEFGPLNVQPRPGRQWAGRSGRHADPDRGPRPRMRATYTRTQSVDGKKTRSGPEHCSGRSHRKPIHTRRASGEETDRNGGAVVFHTGYQRDRITERTIPPSRTSTRILPQRTGRAQMPVPCDPHRSLDPTGTGRARWTMRWQPVINAFAITFSDRWPAADTY
jgi:hypothetical protein